MHVVGRWKNTANVCVLYQREPGKGTCVVGDGQELLIQADDDKGGCHVRYGTNSHLISPSVAFLAETVTRPNSLRRCYVCDGGSVGIAERILIAWESDVSLAERQVASLSRSRD